MRVPSSNDHAINGLAGTENPQPIDNPIGSRLSPMSPVRSVTYVSGPDKCPTRGVGRTRTMFHNTLVVGSSPTSSTTQSRANRRIPAEKRATAPAVARRNCSHAGAARLAKSALSIEGFAAAIVADAQFCQRREADLSFERPLFSRSRPLDLAAGSKSLTYR